MATGGKRKSGSGAGKGGGSVADVLKLAKDSGADIVLVACPLCHSNLDLRQCDIEKFLGVDLEIPVLYFTQLLAVALGEDVASMDVSRHHIDPRPVLQAREL